MKGILLVGKFTGKFREINKSLSEHYELRACVMQLNIIDSMLKRKDANLIAVVLDEGEHEDVTITDSLKESYPNVPVVWLDSSLSKESALDKIESTLNGTIKKEEAVPVVEPASEPKKVMAETKKKVVLMVDDSGVFLRSMRSMIEEHYDVKMSTSGLNIQGLVEMHHPDVVLLDYEMPFFDGKQTMMKMRECEEMKNIPIIFVTAVNKKENIMEVLNLKPAGYLLKPVDKERLLQTIREIIGE